MFIQETHFKKNKQKIIKNECGKNVYFSNGASNARGVAMLIDKNLDYKLVKQVKDNEGRWIMVVIDIEETKLLLINVYAPNDDNTEFFHKIIAKMELLEFDHAIWGGKISIRS